MITIVSAVPADAAALAQCAARNFTAEQWTEQNFIGALDKGSVVLIAKENDRLVGFCVTDVVDGEGYVGLIAVDAAWRRQGIAGRMMRQVLTQIPTVLLDVRSANQTAIAFYQSLGFEIVAVRPHAYRHPTDDMITMKKERKNHEDISH